MFYNRFGQVKDLGKESQNIQVEENSMTILVAIFYDQCGNLEYLEITN